MLGRITGKPFPIRSLDQELYADFELLKRGRTDTDAVIAVLVADLNRRDSASASFFGCGIGKPPNRQGTALLNQGIDLLNHGIAIKVVSGV